MAQALDDLGPSSGPFVSVLVVFHARMEFLPSALDSLLRQTLLPDRYEVLVVGPQQPEGWTERASGPRIHFVECAVQGLGGKVAAGVREARGSVVSLLEDDDMFLPTKLEHVCSEFEGHPATTYFQNGFRVMDTAGRPVGQRGPDERAMERWTSRGRTEISGRPASHDMRAVFGVPAGFNNSSISIRREILTSNLALLEQLDMLIDVALFYLALISRGVLILDPTVLTAIRKHSQSFSDPWGETDEDTVRRLRGFLLALQSRRSLLVAEIRRRGTPATIRAIEGQAAMAELLLHLRDSDSSFLSRMRAALRCLERIDTFEVRRYLLAVPLTFLLSPSGRQTPRFYVWIRQRVYIRAP